MKSKGLGDTLEKFTKFTGIRSLAKLTTGFVGIGDCGCNKRKAWLNKQVPYKQNTNGNKHR